MRSRDSAQLGLWASGAMISATLALMPGIAAADAVSAASSTAGTSITAASELVAQQGNGCDPRRPACNRPGRRSTHR
jgi:hypothetical protein